MSQGPAISPHRPELVTPGLPSQRARWIELATSSDHKDVGRLFIGGALGFLVVGLVEFLLMRLQLAVPQNDLIEPITFNRLLSVWGPTILVLFALPLIVGLFTYVLPLQIGARSTAFPRLGNLGFWMFLAGGGVLYASFAYTPPESGVLGQPPLTDDLAFVSNNGVDVWITAMGLSILGLVCQAVNLIVTVTRMRAPGMAWRRVAPFSFSGAVCAWLLVVVGPLMLAALTMLEIDRHYDGVFFNAGEGGAPVYYQHLSWLFFTGAYMVMVISAVGVISEILPVFSGKPLLSRGVIAGSMVAIAVLGTLAWMQNMFSAAVPIGWLYMAMAMALALVVPIGLVFVNWLATLFSGAISLRAPMLFALGAISTLSFGLEGELVQSVIPANWLLANTAAGPAETGYVLVGGPVLAGFAALYYWFPKMTGRTMGEGLAKLSLVAILIGAHLTFLTMWLAGLDGQPVDVYRFYDVGDLDLYNLLTTIGAFILAAGIVVSVVNAAVSASAGTRAGHDPWGGETLEWFALSPPPPHNFDVVPDVRSAEPLRDIREGIDAAPPRRGAPRQGVGRRACSLSRMQPSRAGGTELRRFRLLAQLTAGVTFLLIVVGGIVRVERLRPRLRRRRQRHRGLAPMRRPGGPSDREHQPDRRVQPPHPGRNRRDPDRRARLSRVHGAARAALAASDLGFGGGTGVGTGGARRPHGREQPRGRARGRSPLPGDAAVGAGVCGWWSGLARGGSGRRARGVGRRAGSRSGEQTGPIPGLKPFAAAAAVLLLCAIVAGGYVAGTEEEGAENGGRERSSPRLRQGVPDLPRRPDLSVRRQQAHRYPSHSSRLRLFSQRRRSSC